MKGVITAVTILVAFGATIILGHLILIEIGREVVTLPDEAS